MVLLSHSRNTFFPAYGNLPMEQQNIVTMAFTMFCRMGHEAVIIFFVLSGFLVGGRGFERIKAGTMNIRSYAIDRFSRIYPPLIAAIILCGITTYITGETECTNFTWLNVVGNIFNLQGICCQSIVSPFWSLSYEVWFYIILGTLAFVLMSHKNTDRLIGILLFVASVSVFVMGLSMHYLFIWLMGAVAFITRPQKKNKVVLLLSFLGFFACVVYWQFSKDSHSLEMVIEGTNKKLLEIIMSLMACLFLQQVILFEPQSRATIKIEKSLGYMAKFSYTLYLSHRVIFLWIIAYLWPMNSCDFSVAGIAKFTVVIIICLVSCWCLYLVSERFSPNIKKYLKAKFL